jgi:hypothetical protein
VVTGNQQFNVTDHSRTQFVPLRLSELRIRWAVAKGRALSPAAG